MLVSIKYTIQIEKSLSDLSAESISSQVAFWCKHTIMVRVEKYTKKWGISRGYNPLKGDTWNNKSVISLRGFLRFKLFDNE